MLYKTFVGGLIVCLCFLAGCSVFEPDPSPAVLKIDIVNEGGGSGLDKPADRLDFVDCVVKQGSDVRYLGSLVKDHSGYFSAEISPLEPGDGYSVLVFGKRIPDTRYLVVGYASDITLRHGQVTTVRIAWVSTQPMLLFPTDGDTVRSDTLGFHWSGVVGSTGYVFWVDDDRYFRDPEIYRLTMTEDPSYTPVYPLPNGTYFWKVSARIFHYYGGTHSIDGSGVTSDVESFTVCAPGAETSSSRTRLDGKTVHPFRFE